MNGQMNFLGGNYIMFVLLSYPLRQSDKHLPSCRESPEQLVHWSAAGPSHVRQEVSHCWQYDPKSPPSVWGYYPLSHWSTHVPSTNDFLQQATMAAKVFHQVWFHKIAWRHKTALNLQLDAVITFTMLSYADMTSVTLRDMYWLIWHVSFFLAVLWQRKYMDRAWIVHG